MLDSHSLARWVGHAVHDPSGDRIGDLVQVYVSESGQPLWLVVKRATMTTRSDLAPASAAWVGPSGLTLSFGAPTIHGSPRIKDRHHLTADEEQALNSHYHVAVAG